MVFKSTTISADEKTTYGYVVIVFISTIIAIGVSRGLYTCLNPILQRRKLSNRAIRVQSSVALETPLEISGIPMTTETTQQPVITISGPLVHLSREEAQQVIKHQQKALLA
jgi:hypothetical protein